MIYVSTSCLRNKRIGDTVAQLAKGGFRNIELSGGTRHYSGMTEDMLSLKEKHALKYIIHNYFPPPRKAFVLNLASSDIGVYRQSAAHIYNSVILARTLNAKLYSFHPGYIVEVSPHKKGAYFDYYSGDGQSMYYKKSLFYKRFDNLLEELHGDVPIAIENLFPFSENEDYSLFSRPDDITEFLRRYADRSNIGLLLDLGHLKVTGHYMDFDSHAAASQIIEEFSDKIFEIHISENDGTEDQHRIMSSGSWQVEVIREHVPSLTDVPVTVELHDIANLDELVHQVNELEEALKA